MHAYIPCTSCVLCFSLHDAPARQHCLLQISRPGLRWCRAVRCTAVHCRVLHLALAEQGECGIEGAGAAMIYRCMLHCVVVDRNSRKNLCLLQDEMSPEAVMVAAIKGKGRYGNWRMVD